MKHVEDAPPADPPPEAQGFGELVWSPPKFVGERAQRARRRASGQAQVLALLALAVLLVAAVGPDFEATFRAGIGVLGVALLIGFVWGIGNARAMGEVHFAVRKNAVDLPASFESAPGLSSLGPPVTLKLGRITRYEDMRKPEGRAVIVWSGTGQGGVVSNAIGAVDLTPEEQETILDGFVGALKQVGVPEENGRETAYEDDAVI